MWIVLLFLHLPISSAEALLFYSTTSSISVQPKHKRQPALTPHPLAICIKYVQEYVLDGVVSAEWFPPNAY